MRKKKVSEQIYEAIVLQYDYNASKQRCIKIIERILNSATKPIDLQATDQAVAKTTPKKIRDKEIKTIRQMLIEKQSINSICATMELNRRTAAYIVKQIRLGKKLKYEHD